MNVVRYSGKQDALEKNGRFVRLNERGVENGTPGQLGRKPEILSYGS
jgi:hypothetical protein